MLETLDPSDLLAALEGLDKYTSSDVEEEPYPPTTSTLLHDSFEEEDANVGWPLRVTRVTQHAAAASPPAMAYSERETLLALTIPGRATAPATQPVPKCLTLAQGLDGATYMVDGEPPRHVGQIPALAYVLASKKPNVVYSTLVQRSGETPRAAAIAFDPAPLGSHGAGRLFMYTAPRWIENQPEQEGESRVLDLGHEYAGPLLDVVEFATQAERGPYRALFCMSQEQLTIVQGLL